MTKNNQTVKRATGETTGVLLEALGLAIQSKQPVLVLDRRAHSAPATRQVVSLLRNMVESLQLSDINISVLTQIAGLRGLEVVSYSPVTFDEVCRMFELRDCYYLIKIHSRYNNVSKS